MKKFLLTLLAMTMATTVAFAAEDTVDYEGTTYGYGGEASETTDDNDNGRLDGLILRGVEEATYYSAGEGFLYFTPATEEAPATIILDNATMVADYCIQAVTDVDLILVGENLLHGSYFCLAVVESYDENMEVRDYQDWDFGAVTIAGNGTLQAITNGDVAWNVGSLAIHSGDISITVAEGGLAGIKTTSDYETSDLPGFWMDGGSLDIAMSEDAGWGMDIASGDIVITGGDITITGGASDSIGILASAYTKDVAISITGGTTVIETNSEMSFGTVKYDADITIYAVVDFTDDPEGVFVLDGMFHFCDVVDINANTGTVVISGFDGVMVESAPQLNVTGLSDYLYCVNEFATFDLVTAELLGFEASMVGQPTITDAIRYGLSFPYTTSYGSVAKYTFTRAQAIALLWDAMGQASSAIDNPFTDVSAEDGYYNAILWAVEAGITNGTTATTFDPDALCTKGQLLTFLYRNAGTPEVDVENIFADVEETSYLYDAVLWGIANTMMDVEGETFDAANTVLSDGAVGYLICMGQ